MAFKLKEECEFTGKESEIQNLTIDIFYLRCEADSPSIFYKGTLDYFKKRPNVCKRFEIKPRELAGMITEYTIMQSVIGDNGVVKLMSTVKGNSGIEGVIFGVDKKINKDTFPAKDIETKIFEELGLKEVVSDDGQHFALKEDIDIHIKGEA